MSSQPNQSLIDGLTCLQALASASVPIGSRELARELELDPTRVNRLLKTMADIGLAQQDDKRKYYVGPGIHALAAQSIFGSGLLRSVLPLLKQIPYPGILVGVGVLWRDKVTYLYHGKLGEDVELGIGRMGLYPVLRSSIGVMLLSEKSDPEIKALVDQNLAPFESATDLLSVIRKTRKQEYSELINSAGQRNIAVPIGRTGGVAIAFSDISADRDIKPYLKHLRWIQDELSQSR